MRRGQVHQRISKDRISATVQIKLITGTIERLERECLLLGPEESGCLKAAMDGRFKLLAKVQPDIKAIEISGHEGGPIEAIVSLAGPRR